MSENGKAPQVPENGKASHLPDLSNERFMIYPDSPPPSEAMATGNDDQARYVVTDPEDLARIEQIQWELAAIDSTVESLDEWVGKRSGRYVFRLSERLHTERESARKAREHALARGRIGKVPDAQTLIDLGRDFVRRLWKVFLLAVVLISGLFLLRRIFTRLVGVFAPDSLASIIVEWMVGSFYRDLIGWVISGTIATIIVLTFSVLLRYYRGWSEISMKVQTLLYDVRFSKEIGAHTKAELDRLESLHKTLLMWMRTLATTLRRPWVLPDNLPVDPSLEMDASTLPLGVRFGAVHNSTRAMQLKTRRVVLQRLIRQEWRQRSFSDLVEAVAESLGMAHQQLDLEQVDREMSASSRQSFLTLSHRVDDNQVLIPMGKRRYDDLMLQIRHDVIDLVRPPVKSLHDDPMGDFIWPGEVMTEPDWVKFGSEIFAAGKVEDTPTFDPTMLNFDGRGQTSVTRTNTTTVAIVPNGFPLGESGVQKAEYPKAETSGVDFTARIELAGPVSAAQVAAFASSASSEVQPPSVMEEGMNDFM